jgi:hypothetical protein
MDQFAPQNLSPLPTALMPCALPYDLTWDDLLPILPGFDTERGHLTQAFASHRKQGLNGGPNSIILTLRYPGGEDVIVFVKSQPDRLLWEAEKYRYLEAHGVPTPRLLAGLRKGEAEVIVLEFLPEIGIDFAAPGEVDAVLRLAAKLNALPLPPSSPIGLFDPLPGMPQEEFDGLVHAALVRMAGNPALGEIDVPRWMAAYRQCRAEAEGMPRAVNHDQFFFQQMGWRASASGRELVIFDLETMCSRPRFADMAGILYALSRFSGRTEDELLRVYLDALRPFNAGLPDFDGALRELLILRVAEMSASLPWLSGEGEDLEGFDSASALSMAAACMREDMEALEKKRD